MLKGIISEMGGKEVKRRETMDIPQDMVISPHHSLIVINTILKELERSGIKVTAFADDVAVLIVGKYPQTAS